MPKIPSSSKRGIRVACVYWYTSSVGGIATHLNSLRTAAIANGDTFDILHSKDWKTKQPAKFKERQWIRGGDTRIWVDGEVPQTEAGAKWLKDHYDVIYFGFICPHETKAYSTPSFQSLYETNLPKVAGITDGYWDDYAEWGNWCLERVKAAVVVQPNYLLPIQKATNYSNKIKVLLAPFVPGKEPPVPRFKTPLLIWPNQFKDIKGITKFIRVVPDLPKNLTVHLYSNGIKYYQLRTTDEWKAAVDKDHFEGFNGNGRAQFFGNVDLPKIAKAYQQAWFTVNLQGMNSRKEAYQKGSYNLTEVEALYYGAMPILHDSARKTALPPDCYAWVNNAEGIPEVIESLIKSKFPLNPMRIQKAREYVMDNHLASNHWKKLRAMF